MAAPQPPGGPQDLQRATFGSHDWQELLAKQLGETLDKPIDMEESPLFRLTSDGALLDELLKTLSGAEGMDVMPLFSEKTLSVLMGTQFQQLAAEHQQQHEADGGGDANSLDAALALLQPGASSAGGVAQEGTAGSPQQQQQQRFRTLQEAAEAIGLIPRGTGAGSPAPGGSTLQRGGGSSGLGSFGASLAAMLAQAHHVQQQEQGQAAQQAQQASQQDHDAAQQQQQQQAEAQAAQQAGIAQAQQQRGRQQQAQARAAAEQQASQMQHAQQQLPQGPYLALLDGQIVAKDGTVVLGTLPQGQQLRLQVPGPDGTVQYIPVLDSRVVSLPGQRPLPSMAMGVAGQQAEQQPVSAYAAAAAQQHGMPGLQPMPASATQQQQAGYLLRMPGSVGVPQQQLQQQAGQGTAAQGGHIGRELSLGMSWLSQAQQQAQQAGQQGLDASGKASFAFARPAGGVVVGQRPGPPAASPPTEPADLHNWLQSLPLGVPGAQQAQQGMSGASALGASAAAAAALCAAASLPLAQASAASVPRVASHESLASMLPITSAAAGPALVGPAASSAPPASAAGVATVLDPTLNMSAIAATQQLVAAAAQQQQVLQRNISSRAASGQLPPGVGVEVQQVHPTLPAQQARQPSDPRLAARGQGGTAPLQQRLSPAHLMEATTIQQQYQAAGLPYPDRQAQQQQQGAAAPQVSSLPVPILRPPSGMGLARSCPEAGSLQLSPPEGLSVLTTPRDLLGVPRAGSQQQPHQQHQLGQLPPYMLDPAVPGSARSVGGSGSASATAAAAAGAFFPQSFSAPQALCSGGVAAALLPSKPSHKRERSMRSANPEGIAPAPKAIRNLDELLMADMDDLLDDEGGCLSSLLDESHSTAPVASSSPFATVSGVQDQLLAFALAGGGCGRPMVSSYQQGATSQLLLPPQQQLPGHCSGAASVAGAAAGSTPRSGGPAAAAALLLTSPPTGRTPPHAAGAAPGAAGRRGGGSRRAGSKAAGAGGAVRAGGASVAAAAVPDASAQSAPSAPSADDAVVEELIQKVLARPPGKRRGRPPGRRNGTLPPEYEAELEEANILRELLQDPDNRVLPVEELKKMMRREKNKKMAAFSRTKNVLHVTQLEDKVRKLSEERDWLARQLLEGPTPNLPPHKLLLPGSAEQAPRPLVRHLSL